MILQIPNRNLTIINRVYLRETLPGFSVTRNNSNALLLIYTKAATLATCFRNAKIHIFPDMAKNNVII